MVERRCPSCRFHGTVEDEISCDYMRITGKSRTAQIPPEERDKPCPFYERGRKVPLRIKPVTESTKKEPRYRFDQRKMRELYDAGLLDHQIAVEVGCTADGVRLFRKRNGLPTNYRKAGERTPHQSPAATAFPPGEAETERR